MRAWFLTSAIVVTCALVGSACKKAPPPPPPDPMAVPKEVGELRLATSTSTAAPPEGFAVYVSRDSVLADRPPKKLFDVPKGADAARGIAPAHKRSGPHDLYLLPLAGATPAGTTHALLYFDRETPYRIVTEIAFTVAQQSVSNIHLATARKDGRTTAIEVFTPRGCQLVGAQAKKMEEDMNAILFALGSASASGRPAPPPIPTPPPKPSGAPLPDCRETIGLTVILTGEGMSIKARGGNVAPGCNDTGPGLALPKSRSNTYDFEGLTTCLQRVKHSSKEAEAEDAITFVANPDVPFEAIASAMDASRIFPKPQLGLAR